MKIFCIGDLHLGNSLLGKKRLRQFVFKNLDKIKDDIHLQHPDYVILAGDIFHKDTVINPDTLKRFIQFLQNIHIHTKRIFIINGNHDTRSKFFDDSFLDSFKDLFNNVTICSGDIIYLDYQTDDAIFSLIPYNKENFIQQKVSVQKRIYDLIDDFIFRFRDDSRTKILISHFSLDKWMPFNADVELEKLPLKFFDYIVLGDLHRHDLELYQDNCFLFYTGSIFQTNIRDLINHENCYKIIDTEDIQSVKTVYLEKPKLIFINDEKDIQKNIKNNNNNTIIFVSDPKLLNDCKLIFNKVIDIKLLHKEEKEIENLDSSNVIIDTIDDIVEHYINLNLKSLDSKTKKLVKDISKINIDDSYTQRQIDEEIESIIEKNL